MPGAGTGRKGVLGRWRWTLAVIAMHDAAGTLEGGGRHRSIRILEVHPTALFLDQQPLAPLVTRERQADAAAVDRRLPVGLEGPELRGRDPGQGPRPTVKTEFVLL